MAIQVRIKDKKISECSFEERTVLAIVHTHYITVFGQFYRVAATGDAALSMIRSATEKPTRELRDEMAEKAHEQSRSLTKRMTDLYFPNLEFDLVVSDDQKAHQPLT